jgi:hypothetical protein
VSRSEALALAEASDAVLPSASGEVSEALSLTDAASATQVILAAVLENLVLADTPRGIVPGISWPIISGYAYVVSAEGRAYPVAIEDRAYPVPAEGRTYSGE